MNIKGSVTVTKALTVGTNVQTGNGGLVKLSDADSSNFINLKAPSTVSSDVTLTFPATVGSNGQALTTDGTSGVLSWTTISSGANPAGSGSELQYRSNGTTFGALTNSAVSSSSLSIGTTTTTNAQLTVLSSGASLPPLRVQANAGAAGSVSLFAGVNGGGTTTVNLQTDGSVTLPFFTYSASNRTLTISQQTAPTQRTLVIGTLANFATNTQTEFFNTANSVIATLDATSTHTAGVTLGHEDSVGGASVTLVGAKIFGIANQVSGTGSKSAVYGLECYGRVVNTGGATTVSGALFGAGNTNTATVTNLVGITIATFTNSGTATESNGINIKSQVYSGAGTYRAIKNEGGEIFTQTANANTKGLTIRGFTSQAANLLTLEDVGGSALFSFNSSGYASGQFLNSGFALRDSDSSHRLTITTGSNLTADRSLTLNTGDASRTLTLDGDSTVNGNFSGIYRVFKTLDGGSNVHLQGNVLGANTQGSMLGGTVTIPANWFAVGSVLGIRLKGTFDTSGSAGTYRFRLKLGSTVIADSTAITMTNSLAAESFELDLDVNCYATGASGSAESWGSITYNSSGTTPVRIKMPSVAVTFNTTTAQNLDLTVEMSSGVSGNVVDTYTAIISGHKA